MQNIALLIGRLALSLIFILSGFGKLQAYTATTQSLIAHGLPGGLLPLVIFAELGGGLAVLTGFLTRWAALGLFAFCLLTAFFFHNEPADHAQWLDFMKDIAIAGGFLVLAVHGPGTIALDALRQGRKKRDKLKV
jgi:putative oxidoreductase